ncbi:GNAT family N-acetyltransferase [Thalassobius vesicularis]|uniref:GNAT family N-acetyltransferase n=1 Tax=Thalassobius vesicularis TaxID=1294297 RepID=A0A4S3MDI1_9RHOB|nr:GNAT family N-acetyltransferase [Thalassobius vesicularis]THD75982.1 GNAT family N-acetyltransferase [Thalassobius vesicularis]
MPQPQILPFTDDHIAPARALWQTLPGVGLSAADKPAALATFLRRNPGLSRVAVMDDRLIGTILIGHDGRRGLIHHLAVSRAHRRQGLARRLLDAGLAGLHAEGIGRAHLFVFADNAEALAFWRATGALYRDDLEMFSIPL